jgi:1-acyl-sn-glycerol-3-phosphate acyltransferase
VDWSQPQVLVSNHISGYDIFAIAGVMPGPFAFVAKKELERIPVFGRAWKAAGHISIDRSDRQKAIQSLQRAAEKMRRDRTAVIIYPEGTRSRSGALQPFKKGAFVLAQQAGVPIVPVVVRDSDLIQRPGSHRIDPRPIHLHFCPAIRTDGPGEQGVDALIERARAEMLRVLAEERGAHRGP